MTELRAPMPPPREDLYAPAPQAPPPAPAVTAALISAPAEGPSTRVYVANEGAGAMAPPSNASSEQSTPRPHPRAPRSQQQQEFDVEEPADKLHTQTQDAGRPAAPPDSGTYKYFFIENWH